MRPLSLRAHFVLGAVFWTIGLFGLSTILWHRMLGFHEPPRTFFWLITHAHAFGLISLVSLVAGIVQIRRGWQSIAQIRAGLAELHAVSGRRLEGAFASEIAPLVADLNELLDQRDVMVGRANAAAGDLAHGLKTPLAVMTQEAERASRQGHQELASALLEQIDRMRRQVDAHLARSRADLSKHRIVVTPVSVSDAAAGVVRTLQHLYAERGLAIAVDVDPSIAVLVAREDLDEVLGNLLDNACKWARSRCSVTAQRSGARVALIVEDDGPGISAAMRQHVLTRGVRADEAVPGTGLGLSIVRDLTEAYGGQVVLDESPLGGLRVTIDLPIADSSAVGRRAEVD
jgi:signal transduction histidine kinase